MRNFISSKNFVLAVSMLVTAYLGYTMTPELNYVELTETQKFINAIPTQFADWKEIPTNQVQMDLVPKDDEERTIDNPYDDILMRTYENSKGQRVQLALAYGKSMRQEVKIHRPELCYYAQGFQVKSLASADFGIVSTNNQPVSGKNMLAENQNYQEAVSYWIRIGEMYSQSPWQTRFYIIKQGLVGNVVDGVLVRASVILFENQRPEEAYQLNKLFLQDLSQHVSGHSKKVLLN